MSNFIFLMKWAERVVRNLIQTVGQDWVFSRRLPKEFGSVRLFVSSSVGLKYIFKPMRRIDPFLLSVARDFVSAGHSVWDIGANVGLFSFAAASKAGESGHVIAFEPDVWLVQQLRRSAEGAPARCAKVTVVPAAVAQDVRIREFQISARSRAKSSLAGFGYVEKNEKTNSQTVVCVNLDWALQFFPAPDVIKIDVEGAEMEVLKGASSLLENNKPILICEVGAKNRDEVTAFLRDRNYLLFDCEDTSVPRVEKKIAPWNTLAIPKTVAR